MLGNSRTLVGLVAILSALANRLALSDLIESNMRELSHGLLEFGKIKDGERLDPIDYFIEDLFPKFINQRPNNENGTMLQWKDYAMTDESNDDALWLSGVSIRSSEVKSACSSWNNPTNLSNKPARANHEVWIQV